MTARIQSITIDEVVNAVRDCAEQRSSDPVVPVIKKIWDNISIPQMFLNPTPPEHFTEASENMARTYQAITILLAFEVLDTSVLIKTYDSAIAKFRAHSIYETVSSTMHNGIPLVEHTIKEMRDMLIDATNPTEILRLRTEFRRIILESIAGVDR